MHNNNPSFWSGSTILTVRKENHVVIAGDGQAMEEGLVLKSNVRNVRRLGSGHIVVGFTGSTADAVTLFENLENIIVSNPHQLIRACVDLGKFWRKNPQLSEFNDKLVIVSSVHSLVLTATGDVLEKEDGIIGVGVGGAYALAAARALYDGEFSAKEIVEKSMNIASEICGSTHKHIAYESIEY